MIRRGKRGSLNVALVAESLPRPPHIHVQHGDGLAKSWLTPVALAENSGMKRQELKRAKELTEENADFLLEKWNERK